jgi:hypothetical protein
MWTLLTDAPMAFRVPNSFRWSMVGAYDVDYDAYLINDRTLLDPEVVQGRA